MKKKSIVSFYKKELKKQSKELPNNKQEKVKSIVVLVDELAVDTNELILSFKKHFLQEINVLSFCKHNKKREYTDKEFTAKNFGWFGRFKKQEVLNVAKESEVLINYSINNIHIDVLTLLSKANFKVGFDSSEESLYDLKIATSITDYDVFSEELHKYLIILNKI